MMSSRAFVRAASVVPRRATVAAPRRTYATPASSASTKPPVALYGIDGTYASALYTAAAKSSTIDPVAKALNTLSESFKSDTRLSGLLSTPTLTPEDKSAIVTELVKASGSNDSTVKNFLATLADNNRLGYLQGVTEKFAELMAAHRGEVELIVTSAAPLESRVLKQLEAAVGKSSFVGGGKKLKVVPKVQPDIRGGLVVEIGDRTIDLSVSSKLAKLNKLLQDTL